MADTYVTSLVYQNPFNQSKSIEEIRFADYKQLPIPPQIRTFGSSTHLPMIDNCRVLNILGRFDNSNLSVEELRYIEEINNKLKTSMQRNLDCNGIFQGFLMNGEIVKHVLGHPDVNRYSCEEFRCLQRKKTESCTQRTLGTMQLCKRRYPSFLDTITPKTGTSRVPQITLQWN